MPSLIQQRQAIDRQRVLGTIPLVVGLLFLALVAALTLAQGPSWFDLFEGLVGVTLTGSGALRCRRARAQRMIFEAREGADAGKQDPIR